jgi:hypothetical protein
MEILSFPLKRLPSHQYQRREFYIPSTAQASQFSRLVIHLTFASNL